MTTKPYSISLAPGRRSQLTSIFPAAVDCLHRRRASEVSESAIEDFVSLGWLEWNGGGLKVTVIGENLCVAARAATTSPNG